MTVHEIRIDKSKTLVEEPATGHNRWHPDIPPVVRCQPGDEVVMETRDALDGQAGPGVSADALAVPNLDVIHPLTGPVYVEGAEPGDLLAVEILGIEPDSYGFTVQLPGFGFLRDEFPQPFKVDWDIADGWATSADLPGVRIPGAPFMGTIGLPPGHELLATTIAALRESNWRRVTTTHVTTRGNWSEGFMVKGAVSKTRSQPRQSHHYRIVTTLKSPPRSFDSYHAW